MRRTISRILSPIDSLIASIPDFFVNIAMRLVIFKVFWTSVQTKITGATFAEQHFAFWNITENTFLKFYFDYSIPFVPTTLAAYMVTFGEFFFALMIFFGLLTRLAALGLFVITMVIQFYIYPDAWWTMHAFWAVILLYLMRFGGGIISLDRILFNKR
jgi:putative oxidoreductase